MRDFLSFGLICAAMLGSQASAFVAGPASMLCPMHLCFSTPSLSPSPHLASFSLGRRRTGGRSGATGGQTGGRSGARMSALGPIGPLAPFRSDYCASGVLDRDMSELIIVGDQLQSKIVGLKIGFQSGMPPAPDKVRSVAEEMDATNEKMKIILTRLRLADDFQALQFYKLIESRLMRSGMSLDAMYVGMKWQVESMKSFGNGGQPPPMPQEMQALVSQQQGDPGFTYAGLGGVGKVDAMPFVPGAKALESPVVAEEFQALVSEHKSLIKMGGGYGKWDREGRKMYIDQMEAIEERWGIFLARFELMGEMNPEFVRQTDEYLEKLKFKSVQDFKDLLKECRDVMRKDAENK